MAETPAETPAEEADLDPAAGTLSAALRARAEAWAFTSAEASWHEKEREARIASRTAAFWADLADRLDQRN